MRYEVEQKFPLPDEEQRTIVRRRLDQSGVVWQATEIQVDSYFAHPARNFVETDEALRLRQVGDDVCITYKGPKIDREMKTRREIELPLGHGAETLAQFAELLVVLGFHPVGEVRKRRTPGTLHWDGEEITIAWDEVTGLGTFLELELVAPSEHLAVAKSKLLALSQFLNLGALERRGYLALLLGQSPATGVGSK